MKTPATVNELSGGSIFRKTLADLFRNNVREYGMLIALIAVMVFFQFQTNGVLMKPVNITNLVLQNSYVLDMAMGMLLIIITGGIDLPVGSVVAVIGALAGVLIVRYDFNWALVVLICLLLGALIGAFHGYFVAYQKIPAFIVTLAGMSIFRGLTIAFLRGESVGPFPRGFQNISSGFIPDFFHYEGLHITTILIGVLLSILIVWLDVRARRNQRKYGFEVVPFFFFVAKNIGVTAVVMGFSWLMASYKGLSSMRARMGTSCGTSGVTESPLLVSLSGVTDIKTVANGGHVQSSSGYDIIFKDASGVKLDHEIERYDGTAGTLFAWVRVPVISGTTNTVLSMYYGNSSVTSSTENKTGVWDSNYKGVWHLKESGNGTVGEYKDSTQYTNHGQGGDSVPVNQALYVPTHVSGKIEGLVNRDQIPTLRS